MTPSRAASTAYGYRNIVRCHLLPVLGDVPLADLSPLLLQTYLSMKLGEGLSPNTVLKHYTLLHTALGQAVRLDLLSEDPAVRPTAGHQRLYRAVGGAGAGPGRTEK